MAFGGADFTPSRTPEASRALQLAAQTAVNAAARKSKNLREFSAAVKELFEAANGVGWHVLAGSDFAVDLRYRKGACVLLSSRKSKLKVVLYRTTPALTPPLKPVYDLSDSPSEDAAAATRKKSNGNKHGKVVWHGSDMDAEMQAQVLGFTLALLAKLRADTAATVGLDTRLAQSLKLQLSFAFGNTWHTVVATSRELCCLPYCDPNTFADFSIDALRVVVYRHSGADVDTKIDMTQFAYRATLTVSAICFVLYSYFNIMTTELHTTCGAEPLRAAVPEGCSEEDVAKARAHNTFKSSVFVGLVVFTVIASTIRMYRRALRAKLKHG